MYWLTISSEVKIIHVPYHLCSRGLSKQHLCVWVALFSPQIHSNFFLLVPWLQTVCKGISQKGSWGSVCFLSYTTSLNLNLGRSPSQYKWKIRFFLFYFLWFYCNGSLKESLEGHSGMHFSSSCLISYIWTTSAISLLLLDSSSEKLKNYLFMIISFFSAF